MGAPLIISKAEFYNDGSYSAQFNHDYLVVPHLRDSNVALSNRAHIPRVSRQMERRTKKVVSRNFYAYPCWHRCRLGPDSSQPHGCIEGNRMRFCVTPCLLIMTVVVVKEVSDYASRLASMRS